MIILGLVWYFWYDNILLLDYEIQTLRVVFLVKQSYKNSAVSVQKTIWSNIRLLFVLLGKFDFLVVGVNEKEIFMELENIVWVNFYADII